MTKEQIYELIKILLKNDISFGFNDTVNKFMVYDDVVEITVYDKDLGEAIKKFIIAVSDRYSNNFVKELFKIAGMQEKYYEN